MLPLIFVFVFGIFNFAAHKAMLNSGHPVLQQMSWFVQGWGGRLSFAVEFLMLLSAMILADGGSAGWAWFYGLYTAMNAVSAWLLLSGRV